jgi:mono/diheme cytochrome c family protein
VKRIVFLSLLSAATAFAAAADVPEVRVDQAHRGFFEEYCFKCHGKDKPKAGVRLDELSFTIGDVSSAERWQKVLNAMNSGEMPPDDQKQPPSEAKVAVLEHLSGAMVAARKALADTGGVITMRRLNRREYQNTIEDLLGVSVDGKELPNDGGGGGFDTFGKSLFLSSDQFEQYLTLARKALDQVIACGPRPETRRVHIEAEEEANQRITHILRFYQMGGYRAYKQWKASNGRPTTDFGIVDEAEMKFRLSVWERNTAPMIDYLTRPETKTGALLTIMDSNPQVGVAIPDEMPAGRYRLRASIGAVPGTATSRHFVELGVRGKSLEDAMNLIDCRRVSGSVEKPEVLEFEINLRPLTVPLSVEVGPETKKRITLGERVFAFRERMPNSREYAAQMSSKAHEQTGFGVDPALWIDWVEWEGPMLESWPTPAHSRLFFKGESALSDDAYAREILERFALKAFRGKPLKPRYLDKLAGHYRERRAAGDSFEQALKEPLSIVLASPSFLYLNETGEAQPSGPVVPVVALQANPPAGPGGAGLRPSRQRVDLSGTELATRLAYFLWSAPPDEELLALGKAGALRKPDVLAAQTRRLLASPKAWRFVTGFAHQWLGMERLDFFQFNSRLYPGFDDSVKRAARDEVFHTIRVLLEENRPAASLLKSDFVVINDLLAAYYGLAAAGPDFRKVDVPPGTPRGGLLGMAAVLAMGSDGERSSPVERGAWVLRKLLHEPPPPAPPNVPQISRHAGKLLSARELLTAHQEEAQCAQCHRRIDPIGFGLEHFNAAGLWREREVAELASGYTVRKSKEHTIDASGTLSDGTKFDGFFELRDAVASRKEAFLLGLVEQLVSYALGRPAQFSDDDLCARIVRESGSGQSTLRDLVLALVASRPFQTK